MDLILWRHAEALDGTPDLSRRLTPKGHKQAEAIAAWLASRLPKPTRILVSPAARTQETAQALERRFETVASIAPGADATAILAAADWPNAKGAVLVVGHQPTLGEAAALLLAGETREFSVKKGGVWWLSRRVRGELGQVVLRAVVNPDLV
jgi:phosphohistidine phosphatase